MQHAKFSIGQIVHHRLFDYRGVVVDVDFEFEGSPEWYEKMALSRPPKEQPWYHVLVDNGQFQTYVAERNLERSDAVEPIAHPLISTYFEGMENGFYLSRSKRN